MKVHQQLLLEARSSLSTMKAAQQQIQQQVELESKLSYSQNKFDEYNKKVLKNYFCI